MKIAIMQPYIFPYIGYFQLIYEVDKFIFYDDVNYIKSGWVNRNRILVNNSSFLFTVPLNNASSFVSIRNTDINKNKYVIWVEKFLKTIEQSYKKAPYFKDVYQVVCDVMRIETNNIAELSENSIKRVVEYLKIPVIFENSSVVYSDSKGFEKAQRLIEICKLNFAKKYINPIGGKELYEKTVFYNNNIELFFIESKIVNYKQFNNNFIGGLSIIDVMMFNSIEEIGIILKEYQLI